MFYMRKGFNVIERIMNKTAFYNQHTFHPEKSHSGNNVAVIAWARARDGTSWQLVLSFPDRDGRNHQPLVKRSQIIRGDFLFELLDEHGYPIPTDAYGRAALRRSILATNPEQRLLIA